MYAWIDKMVTVPQPQRTSSGAEPALLREVKHPEHERVEPPVVLFAHYVRLISKVGAPHGVLLVVGQTKHPDLLAHVLGEQDGVQAGIDVVRALKGAQPEPDHLTSQREVHLDLPVDLRVGPPEKQGNKEMGQKGSRKERERERGAFVSGVGAGGVPGTGRAS